MKLKRLLPHNLIIICAFLFLNNAKAQEIITDASSVTLTSFTARKEEANVFLRWQTTSEINSSHFEIERSSDG